MNHLTQVVKKIVSVLETEIPKISTASLHGSNEVNVIPCQKIILISIFSILYLAACLCSGTPPPFHVHT